MDVTLPLWVLILLVAIGVVGTLLAALVSQAVTARRESQRAREQVDQVLATTKEERAREDARREDQERQRTAEAEVVRRQRVEESERGRRERLQGERRKAYVELLVTASRWRRYMVSKRDQREARNGALVPVDSQPFADAVDIAFASVQILGAPEAVEAAAKLHHNLFVTEAHLEATHFSAIRVNEGLGVIEGNLAELLHALRVEHDLERGRSVQGPVQGQTQGQGQGLGQGQGQGAAAAEGAAHPRSARSGAAETAAPAEG